MNDTSRVSESYLVEVSGWGLDEEFFVEKTELFCNEADGDRKIRLRQTLNKGTVIFVRLLAWQYASGQMPVAYRVESIQSMTSADNCEIHLLQLHPRSKVSVGCQIASKEVGTKYRDCEPKRSGMQSEFEEVPYEA